MPNLKALIIKNGKILVVKEDNKGGLPQIGTTSEKRVKKDSGEDYTIAPQFTGYLGGGLEGIKIDISKTRFKDYIFRMYTAEVSSSLTPYWEKVSWINSPSVIGLSPEAKKIVEKLVEEEIILP